MPSILDALWMEPSGVVFNKTCVFPDNVHTHFFLRHSKPTLYFQTG